MKWEKSIVFGSSGSISVEGLSVLLQCVDDVHGGNSFSLGSFSINNRVFGDLDEHSIDKLPGGIV